MLKASETDHPLSDSDAPEEGLSLRSGELRNPVSRREPPVSVERLRIKPEGAEVIHPSKDLGVVMDDVLRSGTDDAYCFLNEGALRDRMGVFRDHFLPEQLAERRIIYAMKANPRDRIMDILASEGLDGFDCASLQEINRALQIDQMSPEDVYFNHPIKRPSEAISAFAQGVRYFTAQSRSGLEKVLLAKGAIPGTERVPHVAVRVETQNPDAAINLSDKYGCPQDEALDLLREAEEAGTEIGLAMHTGSQNTNPESFTRGVRLLSEMANRVNGVHSINLGGGIPANHDRREYHEIREYLAAITDAVRDAMPTLFKKGTPHPRVIIEPGRSLVAESVDLAIPVLEIDKRRRDNRVFMGDGVFTCFSDAVIHGWEYNFDVFTKDGRRLSDDRGMFTLHGRTCDSKDTLGQISLPVDIKEGDFLWVRTAGAYMDSQSTQFNGFGPPKYVSYNSGDK